MSHIIQDPGFQIKFDTKKITALRKVHRFKNVKITPQSLEKLRYTSVENIFPKESTSTSTPLTDSARRVNKKRGLHSDDRPKEDNCVKCGCRLLRVVDNGRPDKRLVLECMRRDCLATLKFTEMAVGTVLGAETFKSNYHMRDPARLYYPSKEDIDNTIEQISKNVPTVGHHMLEVEPSGYLVSVPGQFRKARLL